MYPATMLERVYVRGSLKNCENGFELAVKNLIDSASLIGLGPFVVDGVSYPPETITWVTDRGERRGDTLGYRNPVPFSFGEEARIVIQGTPLPPGEHSLTLSASVSEIGRVQFDVKDEVPV